MGKRVRVDHRNRGDASVPSDLSSTYSLEGSTTIVCCKCGGPSMGLILNPEDPQGETFVHRTQRGCDYYRNNIFRNKV